MIPLLAMLAFSFSMSASPGPANMIIVASGANHGFRRTLPFVTGATIGFSLLLVVVGLWFGQIVNAHPVLFFYLGLGGSAFIIYVGYAIASSSGEISTNQREVPSFRQGLLLQWLNPKAWIACTSGVALFTDSPVENPLVTFTCIYFVVCYASLAGWAVLGDRVAVLLGNSSRVRVFNLSMGVMLIVTACYMAGLQIHAQFGSSVANAS